MVYQFFFCCRCSKLNSENEMHTTDSKFSLYEIEISINRGLTKIECNKKNFLEANLVIPSLSSLRS
jgi:hypothetical protein